MNKKERSKKNDVKNKIISKQAEQIEVLELQIEALKLECEEKDKLINSAEHLRKELIEKHSEIDKYKKEYKELIYELRKMKEILNQTVFKGRWRLVKLLIK